MKTGDHFKDASITRRNVLTGLGGIIAAGCVPSISLGAARIVSRDVLDGAAKTVGMGMMRNICGRMDAMMEAKSYDTEVEYLESHGTEYIDTGLVIGSARMKAEGTIMYHTISCKSPMGARKGEYNDLVFCVAYGKNEFKEEYRGDLSFDGQFANQTNIVSRVSQGVCPWQNEKFTFTHSADGTFVNMGTGDVLATKYTKPWVSFNPEPAYKRLLFFGRDDETATRATMRGYSFKIWDNGVLLRDMIPVLKNGVGYMYDRCGSICPLTGNSLYANAGTGAFAWG